jgi:hypothetical protein
MTPDACLIEYKYAYILERRPKPIESAINESIIGAEEDWKKAKMIFAIKNE